MLISSVTANTNPTETTDAITEINSPCHKSTRFTRMPVAPIFLRISLLLFSELIRSDTQIYTPKKIPTIIATADIYEKTVSAFEL